MNKNAAKFLMDLLLYLDATGFITILDKNGAMSRLLDLEKFTFFNINMLKNLLGED